MRQSKTSLRTLPAPADIAFPGVFAWSPVSSTTVTTAIGADPGAWNAWRNRRLTPSPLPTSWFKRTTGSPLAYRVDHVLSWLAARRGDPFDPLDTWRLSLVSVFGIEAADDDETRHHVNALAHAFGPTVGDVRFTPAGFGAYLGSLLS